MRKSIRNLLTFLFTISLISVGFSDWLVLSKKEIVIKPTTSTARAVAYISTASSVFYTSIEKALEVAALNTIKDTIYVLPGSNPTISRDCTIAAKDELILPYDGTTYELSARDGTGGFADINASGVNTNRKNLVTIASGVTLTVSATASLIVGGVLGHWNQNYAGQIVGNYTEINMQANSKIINHGTINLFGYIKENAPNNDSIIYAESTAIIDMPFVVYDFRGGGFTYAAKDKNVMPFNIFDFPNLRPKLVVKYGAKIDGKLTLAAGGSVHKSSATIIGSSGLFRQGASSVITLKHHGSSHLYTTRDAVRTTNSESVINRTIIEVEGAATLASITLSVSGVSLNTSNFFLPFSYKFHLYIKSNSVVTISNKMKFLKGSKVVIEEGGQVNINAAVAFYQLYFEETTTAGQYYPILYQNTPAKLINNGTLVINNAFGGKVETSSLGATLNTNQSSFASSTVSIEVITGAGNALSITEQTWKDITCYGIGYLGAASDPGTTVSHLAKTTYTSQGAWWLGTPGSGDTQEVIGPLQERSSGGSCLTYDALVTMADGSYKMVGEIRAGDLVKVFDHEIGEIDIAPITFNDDIDTDPELFNVLHLEFSNNKEVKVVYEHGFFDLDTMQYEYIDEYNYESFIGHRFVQIVGEEISEVTLDNAYVIEEETRIVSPVSYYHLDIIIEDLLSMPGGIPGLFNIFEYASDLAYDEAKKAADIEQYGLFTYADFEDRVPYEFYAAFPTPYLKVSLGKGLITEEFIEYLIERYLPVVDDQN